MTKRSARVKQSAILPASSRGEDVAASNGQAAQSDTQAFSLAEWRAAQSVTHVMVLTSGLKVRLRKVDIYTLVATGEIPESLDALVRRSTTSGFGVSEVKEFMPLVNRVVALCLIEPPLAEEADETHITLDEIPILDRMDIFNWSNSAANALRPFLAEQKSDMEPAPNGDDVPHAA